ncbi:MAG TPA: hypothetical protein VL651_14500 [Bacteroidia bacterium]|nr:hypothetical protein [Bacteroidia bacterium]
MERDMGMQLKFIYSFTVNDSAWVNNITLIGDSVKQCLGMYREAARVLRQIPACFTDALRGPKGKNYQYYLPFAFVLTDKKDSVVPGYVTIAKDIPKDPEAFSGEVH